MLTTACSFQDNAYYIPKKVHLYETEPVVFREE